MRIVTSAQMREIERRTVEEGKLKAGELMDRAGFGVADVVRRVGEIAGFPVANAHVIAGRGNNGGDAFVVARHLKAAGCQVEVWVAGHLNQISGEAFTHLGKMQKAGIKAFEFPTLEDWQHAMKQPWVSDIIVDGVLGTGISGPARGPAAGAIQYINSQAEHALVVSIDVPSGLNADTGEAEGDTVLADVTATIGLPKAGLLEAAAVDFVGSLELVDIGIPPKVLDDVDFDSDDELIYIEDVKKLFPRRHRASHKGTFGHALLIGGASGYAGSITLATLAALRSGVGLVSVLAPRSIQITVSSHALEAMVHAGSETPEGALDPSAWDQVRERLADFSAVLIGPGLTAGDAQRELVKRVLADCNVPMIFDADALNVLAGNAEALAKARAPVIITPHPGEMARLIGGNNVTVQRDRRAAAREAVKRTGATVVLKGAGTIVTGPKLPNFINLTGNPGMATGGTGDVLAGLLTGFVAQKISPAAAARAATFLHGRAGDIAALRKCQVSLTAGDVLTELPYAFRDLTLR